ncbi:MAG: single-stranded DNA-binding protein [Candidatus Melainabacteria bacterium HGW-Melainabacteria-1]|nr:MAG: single-stranded DNA-binding protein [Candidatus Melainabacteria bacterium HGW-Melainabacteria-1]
MSSNNQVVLIGHVGNEVNESLRYVNGAAVAELRLAVHRPGKARDGEQLTDWISCEFWERQAEVLAQYAKKGSLLSVAGSLRLDSWEKDGQRRQKVYVRAHHFEFLGSARKKEKVA